ncbi:hypothetical protein AXF42_Ash016959 [Apostasia shenzhenica]|uniref:Uncharacterized protein n=1 Tax=Apostasia shenzhenica TaxID=1088818 RepID=A0A2H9ZRL7_9ASPA|nr:hypothetical protein AXF42_Ash016959 [Apostasia shenzhenica]
MESRTGSEDLGDVLHEAGVCLAEGGELVVADVAVAVGVDLGHHAVDLVLRGRSQLPQRLAELCRGDLPVAVGVEAVEDTIELRRKLGSAHLISRPFFLLQENASGDEEEEREEIDFEE